jgi:hypothetical protein
MQAAPSNATTFKRGDFVVLCEPGATQVGMVTLVRPGRIDVWWCEKTLKDGGAKIQGKTCEPSKLRLASSEFDIPDALRRLRANL